MKFKFIILFVFLALFAKAQDNELVNGTGFASCFSRIKEGTFKGQVDGMLKINTVKGETVMVPFNSDPALLLIVPDPDEVYDVSFKKYLVESDDGKVHLEYKTYASANALQVQLDGKTYELGGIDGACDAVINGLEYEYLENKQSEYLLLHFTKDVGLSIPKSGRAIACFIKKRHCHW